MLECNSRPCYFHLPARSGGTGRRAGLKIPWYLVPCGFDPLLRDHFPPVFLLFIPHVRKLVSPESHRWARFFHA